MDRLDSLPACKSLRANREFLQDNCKAAPSMSSKPEPTFKPADLDAWAKSAAKSAPGGDLKALNWITPDGITVKPLYTAADLQGLKYTDTLPGFEPYLRGPQAARA